MDERRDATRPFDFLSLSFASEGGKLDRSSETTYRELRSLHNNNGLVVVNLDVSESGLDERSDVSGELKVEGISEHGLNKESEDVKRWSAYESRD